MAKNKDFQQDLGATGLDNIFEPQKQPKPKANEPERKLRSFQLTDDAFEVIERVGVLLALKEGGRATNIRALNRAIELLEEKYLKD